MQDWLSTLQKAGTLLKYKNLHLHGVLTYGIILFLWRNMTLFFSLEKLEKQADGNDPKFMQILWDHHQRKLLKRPTLNKVRYKPINGSSYLLNPQPLFNQNIDIAYVVQYVKLAARRDYTLFTLFQQIALDLSYFPDLDVMAVGRNPLLIVKTKHIQFKSEEIYYGAKFR